MKENGWVCETYEEFKAHCKYPKCFEAGRRYEGQQEDWYKSVYESNRDKIVHVGGSSFPFMDIRYLEIWGYYEEKVPDLRMPKEELLEKIANMPDRFSELMHELDNYYYYDATMEYANANDYVGN